MRGKKGNVSETLRRGEGERETKGEVRGDNCKEREVT